MARLPTRSIPLTIVLSAFAVALSIALLVGWTLVILQNAQMSAQVTASTWLLISGIVSFAVIVGVLIWFSVFLVREIREGRRQTTFIDSVTHELNSPLASLKLCLETLSRHQISEEQREELRQMMLDDVDRLAVFIEDILVASRVASRRLDDDKGYLLNEVNLYDLAERCVDVALKRHHLAPTAIAIEIPSDLTLTTDDTALETVLKNLLDNAIKYSDGQVDVRVVARRTETNQVELIVTDTGIGIPPKHLKRIFDRFYRAPGEAVRARRGTGLGLFVVSALVRSLGGRTEATSEPGQGTRMRILLPAGSTL